MSLVKAADNTLLEISKNSFRELENKIFEKLTLDYKFKDILLPFAVLEKNDNHVSLGSTKDIVSRIHYNYSLESALRELVSAIVGDRQIKVEIKTSEREFQAVKKRIDKKLASQEEELIVLDEIEAQRNKGKCNLIPFPIKENKVRSELTIERHALFAANTFKGDFRTHEREIKDPKTGESFKLRVKIGDPTGRVSGVLKQKHQEAFYKLSQIWSKKNYQIEENERRKLKGFIELSAYDLVQLFRGNDGGRNYKDVFQLIDEMATIRINIEKTNCEDGTCDIKNFTLLSYEWYAKRFNKETLRPNSDGESNVSIYFSELVTDQFLRKNVKSLMLDPYLSLKDQGRRGTAQLLYTMLDYELSTKENFNISLVNLSDRLGLAQYEFKSKRKEKLKGSINMINGVLILDEKYKINCYLTESEDKKDWVLVARRSRP